MPLGLATHRCFLGFSTDFKIQISEFFSIIFNDEQGKEEDGQGEQEEGGHRCMEGYANVPLKVIRSQTKLP